MAGQPWDAYALLLVDVQRDFWPEEMARAAPEFPARVELLLDTCRTVGMEVIHVHARFQPDMSDWMNRYKLRGRIPCVAGTPGATVLPAAEPLPGETVVVKQTFDAFLRTDLDAELRRSGRRFLLVAGLITSTCVLLTAATATQLGYLVALVEDCCADDPDRHREILHGYPFIFSRTTAARLAADRRTWDEELLALAADGDGR